MVSKPRNPALGEVAAGGDRLPVHAVLQDHAVVVNLEVSGEATGLVAVASYGEPLVDLLEALDLQRGKAHPGRGDGFRLARCQPQAPDRERIRGGRPLEVNIDAVGNLAKALTIARPVALAVRREPQTSVTAVLELDLHVASAPAGVDLDRIACDIRGFLVGLQDQSRELEPTS